MEKDKLMDKACWTPKEITSRMDLMIKSGQDVNEEFYRDITPITAEYLDTPIGSISSISSELLYKDKLEHFGVMWGYKRNNYMIKPGIYAIGNPKPSSLVIVSCNYKLTFDILRKDLRNVDCWLLILETNGVNVWCASGKGTFGTEELIRRIRKVKLESLVNHRVLILPQLGASGVDVSKLKKETGFRGIFGPIRSEDIEDYIKNKFKASKEMRNVKFTISDRAKLTPLSFVQNIKYYFVALVIILLMNVIGGTVSLGIGELIKITIIQSIPMLLATVVAAMIFPIALPVIPFKSFALKGFVLSLFFLGVLSSMSYNFMIQNNMYFLGYSLITIALVTNICLNFTGSTTYTSFSGVVKETLWALPACIAFSIIGVILMIISLVWGGLMWWSKNILKM